MKNKIALFVFLPVFAALLAACAFTPGARPGLNGDPAAQATVTLPPTIQPTNTPFPTRQPTPTASPTPDPLAQAAEVAGQYAQALAQKDSAAAGKLLSNYSLVVAEVTRGEAGDALKESSLFGLSAFKAGVVTQVDANTVLVKVSYTSAKDSAAVEESWPLRLENGTWLVNYDNLIDFRTLTASPQTTAGVTILPTRLLRYSDRVRFEFLAQNATGAAVVFGQPNEILGTFHFGDQTVTASTQRLILNPQRSYPNMYIEAKGLFEQYPESIEIRTWKDYQVKPWFTFDLTTM